MNHLVLDHLVRQFDRSPRYESMVVDLYEKEPAGSLLRRRMEANAAGTELYPKLRKIEYDGTGDLFGGTMVVNKTYNISGGIQGPVSFEGDADNTGSINVHYNPQTVELIQRELSRAERELQAVGIDPAVKDEALREVLAAKADPDPSKIDKAIKVLEKVEGIASKSSKAAGAFAEIGTAIGKAAGLIP